MTTLRFALLTLAMLQIAAPAVARTWRVEKDGTGDFAILYEAADACAAGDTILIGPGRFEEYRREPDYQWNAYCCIHLRVSGITLIGSGADETTIGFENFSQHSGYFIIGVSCNNNFSLNVHDLTVSSVEEGMHFQGSDLRVENCAVVGCDLGIATWSQASTLLHQCRFVDIDGEGVLGAYPIGVSIIECEFVGGTGGFSIAGVGGSGWLVRDCEIHDCVGGIQFEQGASGVIERCHVQTGGGNPPAIGLQSGSVFSLYDNEFDGDNWTASFATGGTVITAINNVFCGGSYTTVRINHTPMDFHGNHILNGGGMSVMALWPRGSLNQPAEVDLSGNYWDTTDPAQIAMWIDDYTDHSPMDNAYYVIIDYDPYAEQPVQTEQATWGAVKSLFR